MLFKLLGSPPEGMSSKIITANVGREPFFLVRSTSNASMTEYAKVTDFLKSVEALTRDLLLTPLQTDWQAEFAAIRKDMRDIKTAVEPLAR